MGNVGPYNQIHGLHCSRSIPGRTQNLSKSLLVTKVDFSMIESILFQVNDLTKFLRSEPIDGRIRVLQSSSSSEEGFPLLEGTLLRLPQVNFVVSLYSCDFLESLSTLSIYQIVAQHNTFSVCKPRRLKLRSMARWMWVSVGYFCNVRGRLLQERVIYGCNVTSSTKSKSVRCWGLYGHGLLCFVHAFQL